VPHDGAADPAERALTLAYRHLERRERTASEVRAYLGRQGFDATAAERTLAALIAAGSVDDRRFARLFTADKRELEHWGAQRIRRALLQRGVDAEIVSAALAEEEGEYEVGEAHPLPPELARAVALLRRRFASPPRTRRDRDRALGVLVRKGYEPEIAFDALAAFARGD
jgi:regulatory protein